MYIIQNAWKSITRNKARNILIGIVALVIAVSSCVALSIRQAAETAKEDTLEGLTITAQISYDRSSQISNQMQDMKNSGTFDKSNFDFTNMGGSSLTLDDYLKYTEAQSSGDTYYYTTTSSLNATGELEAYNASSSDSTDTTTNNAMAMPSGTDMSMSGKGGKGFSAQGDFSLTGYSSYDSLMTLFGQDGTYSISEGAMFDEDTSDQVCVISDELAVYNDLSVGDTITLANPNYEDETYTLTICGIYTNSSSDAGSSAFAMSDPANNIYLSYNSLQTLIEKSESLGNTSDGSAVNLTSELQFTYVFSDSSHYETFASKVYDLGLEDTYTVSSTDLAAYESSLTPLETLSTMAGWFFLIVLAIGGVILVVLNIFNLRERKYEVGVLTAIGMKKSKVAAQFVCELFSITFIAIIMGAIIGATVSVPVTNALLANQVETASSSTEELSNNFGKDMSGMGGAPGSTTSGTSSTGNSGGKMQMMGGRDNMASGPVNYIQSVSSATNILVILELLGVGVVLTVISSLAAMITIMRYEPLKILSSRS